jgi:hypothetical protein
VVQVNTASFDAALNFQAASCRLVVVQVNPASFDVCFDFEAARDCLVVVSRYRASFDVCFDFHLSFSLLDLTLNIERRCRVLGIESGKNAHTHICGNKEKNPSRDGNIFV